MSARKSPAPAPLEPHWFQILLAVADRDLHGLAIMNDVLERTGGRMRLWPGMLYRALGRLADMNLVVEIEPPDGRSGGGRTAAVLPHHHGRAPRVRRRSRAARRVRRSRQTQEAAQSLIRCRTHPPPSFGCCCARIPGTCVSARRTCWRRPASSAWRASAGAWGASARRTHADG